jgi:hypothetical protein
MTNHVKDPNDDDVSDALVDDVMAIIASRTPDQLMAFAKVLGMTKAKFDEFIADWKASRVQ